MDPRTVCIQERIEQALEGWSFAPSVDSLLGAAKSKQVNFPALRMLFTHMTYV